MHVLARFAAFLLLGFGLQACDRGSAPDEPSALNEQQVADTAAEAVADATPACSLTMGWDPWEPYHFITPTGEINGLDVELVSAIAAEAGCTIRFERDNWASLLNRIREGEIDLISGATITPDRETYAYFSDPCRLETFALYMRAEEQDDFAGTNLKEMMESGLRVGVTDAYLYGEEITALQDDPALADQFVAADTGEINAIRLLDNRIDGFIEDIFVASAVLRRMGLDESVATHPVSLGGSNEVRLMYSKVSVSEDLVRRFDEGLAQIRESGEYDRIRSRYLR